MADLVCKAFTYNAFKNVLDSGKDDLANFDLLSSMLKNNILLSIQNAGSGHLGTSFSVADIMLILMIYKYRKKVNFDFFSSKGHDAPCLYACLEAFNLLKKKSITKLRKKDGLPGHPDIETKNIFFNTGSLGMGISKSNGRVFANKIKKNKDRVVCILGDGEFQEGQNFESLMFLQNNTEINPIIIMDSNGIQSDKWVKNVKSYDKLESKIKSFGINYVEINGHSVQDLSKAIESAFDSNESTFINANTIKGNGVDFISSLSFDENLDFYPYHAGALCWSDFVKASSNIYNSVARLNKNNITLESFKIEFTAPVVNKKNTKKIDLLSEYALFIKDKVKKDKSIYVLGADLVKDSGCKEVYTHNKNRYIEFGIAEQDMVSFASGLASKNFVPWAHSFACFLTTRAQEQIFNFCTEKRKGVFVGALAGPLPAGPGHSHQMIRDISIMNSMPYLLTVEPLNGKMLQDFYDFYKNNDNIFYIRLTNIPFNNYYLEDIRLPKLGDLVHVTNNSAKTLIICQGPSILEQALLMYEGLNNSLKKRIDILSPSWLNKISKKELSSFKDKSLYIFESSNQFGGFSSVLSTSLHEANISVKNFNVTNIEDLPFCGDNEEILNYHGLSANKIQKVVFGK
jgi:transketolase